MKIEYIVDDKTFDSREQAEAYIESQEETYIVLLTGPDLMNGSHGCTTIDLFKVVVSDNDKEYQNVKNLAKLVINAVSEKLKPFEGIDNTIRTISNFHVGIESTRKPEFRNMVMRAEEKAKLARVGECFVLNMIPNNYEEAMSYVREIMMLSSIKRAVGEIENERN
jgi:hypothetical protein